MADASFERIVTREECNEMLRDAPQPTADDVSLTSDGRRLDTRDAVVQFFRDLAARNIRSVSASRRGLARTVWVGRTAELLTRRNFE